MPGYDWQNGKSNNAVAAEMAGKYPLTYATKILAARCQITQKAARAHLEKLGACEWHHTSKYYNETKYYDVDNAAKKIHLIAITKKLDLILPNWEAFVTEIISGKHGHHGFILRQQAFQRFAECAGITKKEAEDAYYYG